MRPFNRHALARCSGRKCAPPSAVGPETSKIDTFNLLFETRIPNSLIESNEGHWPTAIRTLKNEDMGVHVAILLLPLCVRQRFWDFGLATQRQSSPKLLISPGRYQPLTSTLSDPPPLG